MIKRFFGSHLQAVKRFALISWLMALKVLKMCGKYVMQWIWTLKKLNNMWLWSIKIPKLWSTSKCCRLGTASWHGRKQIQCYQLTAWIFQDFSIIKILREIKFWASWCVKNKMADFALLESPKLISRKIWQYGCYHDSVEIS